MFVATLFTYLTYFYHMVRLELVSREDLRQLSSYSFLLILSTLQSWLVQSFQWGSVGQFSSSASASLSWNIFLGKVVYQYPSNLQLGPLAFQWIKDVCTTRWSLKTLAFFLVVWDFMEPIDVPSDISFQLWYLDDGTFAGTRSGVAKLLELFHTHGPSFALNLK